MPDRDQLAENPEPSEADNSDATVPKVVEEIAQQRPGFFVQALELQPSASRQPAVKLNDQHVEQLIALAGDDGTRQYQRDRLALVLIAVVVTLFLTAIVLLAIILRSQSETLEKIALALIGVIIGVIGFIAGRVTAKPKAD